MKIPNPKSPLQHAMPVGMRGTQGEEMLFIDFIDSFDQ
jgi:hypothetical protein